MDVEMAVEEGSRKEMVLPVKLQVAGGVVVCFSGVGGEEDEVGWGVYFFIFFK